MTLLRGVCRMHGAAGGAPKGKRNALKHATTAEGSPSRERSPPSPDWLARRWPRSNRHGKPTGFPNDVHAASVHRSEWRRLTGRACPALRSAPDGRETMRGKGPKRTQLGSLHESVLSVRHLEHCQNSDHEIAISRQFRSLLSVRRRPWRGNDGPDRCGRRTRIAQLGE